MGMTINESIRELEKARDSIEPCLFMDEAIDQAMKTAIGIMRKYQKIEEIVKKWELDSWTDNLSYESMIQIREVLEDDNSNMDNSDMRSDQSNTEHCADSGTGKEQQKPRECIQ